METIFAFARCRADARRPGVRDRGTDASRRLWFRIGGGVLPSSVACGRRFACKGGKKKRESEGKRERERELSEDPGSADGFAVLKISHEHLQSTCFLVRWHPWHCRASVIHPPFPLGSSGTALVAE